MLQVSGIWPSASWPEALFSYLPFASFVEAPQETCNCEAIASSITHLRATFCQAVPLPMRFLCTSDGQQLRRLGPFPEACHGPFPAFQEASQGACRAYQEAPCPAFQEGALGIQEACPAVRRQEQAVQHRLLAASGWLLGLPRPSRVPQDRPERSSAARRAFHDRRPALGQDQAEYPASWDRRVAEPQPSATRWSRLAKLRSQASS
mmetsp:Transcript_3737/g.8107  ORF Transcript_3737/g.8107 Transcript_3737/m.8107 type:complete len:206 (-) Transcript_3737:244-861(-)